MASDFPRGTTTVATAAAGSGVAASITLPAVPGIAHVLTSVEAKIINSTAATAYNPEVSLTSSSGDWAGVPLVVMATIGNGGVTSDSDEWDGELEGAPGESLTLTFSATAIAGIFQFMRIKWYDV